MKRRRGVHLPFIDLEPLMAVAMPDVRLPSQPQSVFARCCLLTGTHGVNSLSRALTMSQTREYLLIASPTPNPLRQHATHAVAWRWYSGFQWVIVTGPPKRSVGGQTSNGRRRLSALSSSVTRRICNVTHQGQRAAGQSCYVPLGRHLVT